MVTGAPMLDRRLYRVAFIPAFLALFVAAFALGERPRPIGTTLAPDAFDGARATATLTELARTFPRTRPGSPGDDALAARVEQELRGTLGPGDALRTVSGTAETIDGRRDVRTVIAERPGLDSRRIVVLAVRDRAEEDDEARLSGTAALLELARLYEGRATRRTLTFVSTAGGTGGMAGVRRAVQELSDGPVGAVLILGDVAGRQTRRPVVVPWSDRGELAPLRLRRTVEEALRREAGLDPGSPRALVQVARLAVPLTVGAQGPVTAAGLPAVTVQVSGERGPDPGAATSPATLQGFGRGVLRSISALDNWPGAIPDPGAYVVVQRRVLPEWTVQALAAALLLPLLVAAVDGLARVRRRRRPVAVWLRWLATLALPFVAAALLVRLLGLGGVVPRLRGAVDPAALPAQPAVLAVVALFVVLGFLVRAPVARALGVAARPGPDDVAGASAALAIALLVLGAAVWVVNPYTALLLAPALHLWLLAAVPEVRLPRPVLVAGVVAGLVPFALVGVLYLSQLGLGPFELAWTGVLLVAGGTAGPLGLLGWSAILACALGAGALALRKRDPDAAGADGAPVTTRGPLGYAGPGSLGGTGSAFRR
jgi:hypothetical protein